MSVPGPVTEVKVQCPCGMTFSIRQAADPMAAFELARVLWAAHSDHDAVSAAAGGQAINGDPGAAT